MNINDAIPPDSPAEEIANWVKDVLRKQRKSPERGNFGAAVDEALVRGGYDPALYDEWQREEIYSHVMEGWQMRPWPVDAPLF